MKKLIPIIGAMALFLCVGVYVFTQREAGTSHESVRAVHQEHVASAPQELVEDLPTVEKKEDGPVVQKEEKSSSLVVTEVEDKNSEKSVTSGKEPQFTLEIEPNAIKLIDKFSLDQHIASSSKSIRIPSFEEEVAAKRERKQNGETWSKSKTEASLEFAKMKRDRMTPKDRTAPAYGSNYLMNEYKSAMQNAPLSRADNGVVFTERGPTNIGGRTRGLFVDPRDESSNTWIAASVTGGIWKTEDGGQNWRHLTADLPNIIFSWLAVPESNPDIIYASSGESFAGFDGSGVFKSSDGGETWSQIADPVANPDFRTVNRVIVHPSDPDFVLAASTSTFNSFEFRTNPGFTGLETAIYKSTDGGDTWTRVYEASEAIVEDLDVNPFDPSTWYATQNDEGVLVSSDGGDTWEMISQGLAGGDRIEIAPSPLDENRVWASLENSNSGRVLVSDDKGRSWREVDYDFNGSSFDILGGQGFYDNIIVPHPFDANQAYVGGVDLFKIELQDSSRFSRLFASEEVNTQDFLDFINFGGFPGGSISYGSIDPDSLPNIELRFGQGNQMAHRFTVGGRGSGVPDADFMYEDFVEVPFQAWDIDNNRQLVMSFRDQAANGTFDLIPSNTSGDPLTHSREYMYIHLLDYSEEANDSIARMGGVAYEQAYFIWPASATDETIDLSRVMQSSLRLEHFDLESQLSNLVVISDAYGNYNGTNNFGTGNILAQAGNHPDQHNVYTDIVDPDSGTFRLIVANDGGIYVTEEDTKPGESNGTFSFVSNGYNTTQFYGADKAPGVNRYVGGMQDNSTWYTADSSAEGAHDFAYGFGGDGFEVAWNNRDPNLIFGSQQFNRIIFTDQQFLNNRLLIGWAGMSQDVGNGVGPIYSKIASNKSAPDHLIAVGPSGIWRSSYYGFEGGWELAEIDGPWGYAGSNTDAEISRANPNVVYAGGTLDDQISLSRSLDGGESFEQAGVYTDFMMGNISGIESHPYNPAVVFTLYSFADRPKILRSSDFGENWEDISGFTGGNGESTRGFPDVAVNCLFVFPNDTNRIWVGSDIGIIESLDNGLSWNYLDCELGATAVYDFKIQDDQIVIASYGRGIWTATIEDFQNPQLLAPDILTVITDPMGEDDIANLLVPEVYDTLILRVNDLAIVIGTGLAGGLYEFPLNLFEVVDGENEAQLIGVQDGMSFPSKVYRFNHIDLGEVLTFYNNEFDDETSLSDFSGEGFSVVTDNNFGNNPGLRTSVPYLEFNSVSFQLKNPILIEDQILSYTDVALIEPGEDSSLFGNSDFYDYVIVEGALLDSPNVWQPIIGGYDATLNSNWLSAYFNGAAGNSDIEVFHERGLTEVFNPGDTILVRFRVFSDILTVGWGWHIDNFNIESVTTSTEEITEDIELSLYPNPASAEFSWSGVDIHEVKSLEIYDIRGSLVQRWEGTQLTSNTINTSSWPQGTYLLDLQLNTGEQISKKLQVVR